MAKTSKTMASRKRPPPGTIPNATTSSSGYNIPTTAAAVRSTTLPAGPLPSGIDALLAKYARHLPPGGTITVQLVKGSKSSSVDPIAARRAAAKAAKEKAMASSNNEDDDSDGQNKPAAGKSGSITEPLIFPRIAKFSDTVTPPDFVKGSLKDGRMYEEEVPKAKDESDEEESTAYKPSNLENNGEGADPNNPTGDGAKSKKKKRRWRRNDPRPRRWVLQEKAEFFERIRKRRQRASSGGGDDEDDEQGISLQYHGVDESNASKYIMLSVASTLNPAAATMPYTPSSQVTHEQINVQTIHGFHTFRQPYKLASLSMEDAEAAIEKNRNVVTRYMMHGMAASQSNSSEAKAALASGVGGGGRGIGSRPLGPPPKAMSRARLLGKLAGGNAGDDDDVMGDVKYSSKKSGSSKARKELLSTLDDGMTADDDGVLGGANDSEFGGRRRFARVEASKNDDGEADKKEAKSNGGTSTGFEAGAMEEGFYQRDVAAEYEALDYDANEQFDDDDVNVGEGEMMDDGGGYGGDDYDSGDDNMVDSDEEGGSDDDGFGGMATSSGLKAMLAKARGDSPDKASAAAAETAAGIDALDPSSKSGGAGEKGIDKMLDAAKKTSEEMQKKKAPEQQESPTSPSEIKAAVGIEKDKDGKRLITLDAVRREIWLNNGAITSKRLMKKFDVTKKNPDRQALFKQVVFELCTMQKDADGNKLVLKQHYSKI